MKYKNFIFITNTEWEAEPPRCRHQMAIECSKIGKVYFLEKNSNCKIEKVNPNLFLYKTPSFPISRKIQFLIFPLKYWHDKIINSAVKEIIQENNLNKTNTLILNFRYDFNFFDRITFDKIYVCNDDFSCNYNWVVNRILTNLERATAQSSNSCFAISPVLQKKIKKYNENTFEFKPGIQHRILSGMPLGIHHAHEKIKVCYGGYINYRLDFDVMESLLKNSKFDLEIFGPIEGRKTNKKIAQLKRLGLKVSPPKSFDEFTNYLVNFDVLIAPYKIIPNTSATSMPNKILNYLQSGKPVLISEIPNLDSSLSDVVTTQVDSDWSDTIIKLHKENNKDKVKQRILFANEHTWEKTINSILIRTVNHL